MSEQARKVLVTGMAGFVGFHLTKRLLADGFQVVGVDNLNDYYDPSIKHARLAQISDSAGLGFHVLDVADRRGMTALFDEIRPQVVLHMAAQAGVRYSLTNPHVYADSNLVGFLNVLEGCRKHKVEHLVFASSSSVYGANAKMPFSESDNVDHPVSLYAATKKANELMAHSYSHLYGLPVTGLRFFTVYGPWGRPDMAYFKFTDAICKGEAIQVYNNGDMKRDFTYIDDVVEGVARIMRQPPGADFALPTDSSDPASSHAPYRIYNIGNHTPVALMDMIRLLEKHTGREAKKELLPMQPGDVCATYADVERLSGAVGFAPVTSLDEGLRKFVDWYTTYHHASDA